MLWAASCLAFFGFLCTGEVIVPSDTGYDHLSYGEIRINSVEDPSWMSVLIKHTNLGEV